MYINITDSETADNKGSSGGLVHYLDKENRTDKFTVCCSCRVLGHIDISFISNYRYIRYLNDMVRYNELSDKELIDLLRQEDHAAFTEIYNRYWNKLMAIAYNHTKDKSSAKEIVQELFVSLWNRKNNLSIQSLNGYLATAVKFSVYKQIERERKHREIAQREYQQENFVNDDHIVELKFLQEYINGQVEQLPEKCRLVFNYSRVKGMSNAEIAQEMNISEKTVEGHLTKGLKKIYLNLKNSGIAVILATNTIEGIRTLFLK